MTKKITLANRILLFLFLFGFNLYGQPSIFEVLSEEEVVKIEIETDFKTLLKNKAEPEYQPGTFTFLSGTLEGTTKEVKIMPRGNMRRRICFYPPIWVRFSKKDFDHHKFKLVNICRKGKVMDENLFEEYLIYRLYQLLTEYSFDTQLFQIDYKLPDEEEIEFSAYGFFIEHKKELAKRTGTKDYDPTSMRPRILEQHHYARMALFQYIVGNTDWHITNLHNLKFFRSVEEKAVIAVPYDFDYSGFVNASYAVPHESLPIKSVSTHYNKADCFSEEIIDKVLPEVLAQKQAMIDLVMGFELLPEKRRENLVSFLEEGFSDLKNKKKVRKLFVKNCQ